MKSNKRYLLGFVFSVIMLLLQAIPAASVIIAESNPIWNIMIVFLAILMSGYAFGFFISNKTFFRPFSKTYKIVCNVVSFVPLALVLGRAAITIADILKKVNAGIPDVLSNAGVVLNTAFYVLLILAIALPIAGHLKLSEETTEDLYYESNVNGKVVKVRKKMSNRNFRKIVIPICSVVLVVCFVVTTAGNIFAAYLDNNLGTGERNVAIVEGSEKWDTDYYGKIPTPEKAKKLALETLNKVTDEGMILLKNNGVLPLAPNSSVSPFGKGYVYPFYDSPGEQSSMKHSYDYAVSPEEALASKFNILSYAADLQPGTTTKAGSTSNGNSTFDTYPDQPGAAPGTKDLDINSFGANGRIPELSVSRYSELSDDDLSKMKDSVGLVFISRTAAEGMDLKYDGYTDGTPHYLALTQNEKDMIKEAKRICSKIVVLVNSSNPIELQPVMAGDFEADAILWVGAPGEEGFHSMARILCGEVNPSGRTYDIMPADFLKGPEMANFGNFTYSNVIAGTTQEGETQFGTYMDYAEGVYYGYRYYETAHDIKADGFTYGQLTPEGGILEEGAVCYPFGYGLSYTTFAQSITSFDASGDDIVIGVKVENTGNYDGKEVVQVYYNPPYTDYDMQNGIEKPTATLCAFTKTDIIKKGESTEVELSFSKEELAAYNAARDNEDGTTGCYMLEEGTYQISLRNNSHTMIESRDYDQSSTIFYDNSNPRQYEIEKQAAMDEDGNLLNYPEKQAVDDSATFIAATNQFPYMTEYMKEEATSLTRSNWNATVPVDTRANSNEAPSKELGEKYVDLITEKSNFDLNTNTQLGTVEGSKVYTEDMPVSNADNSLTLADMRGKDFYDKDWDKLLDQIDWEGEKQSIKEFLVSSNYYTPAIDSIGLFRTKHTEGANGIRVGSTKEDQFLTVTWCMCPVMSATWNTELATEIGAAMALEALANGVNARYSPAFNIHRSPFCGRTMEYYSEDPFLTGMFVTNILNASTTGGLVEYMKHFGLNDQETNRSIGVHIWASEQVVREIYNKPFEMCIRNARKTIKYIADEKGAIATKIMRGATGMMIAQNGFGPCVAWVNYDLMTGYVRNEMNFNGIINTDWSGGAPGYTDMTIFAGTDTWLTGSWDTTDYMSLADMDSATARTAYRKAIHHAAYQIANSNAMQGVGPGSIITYAISPWRVWLIVINIVSYAIVAIGIAWMILRTISRRKNPEKYRK